MIRVLSLCLVLMMCVSPAFAQPRDVEYETALAGLVDTQNQVPQMLRPIQDQMMAQIVRDVAAEKGETVTPELQVMINHMNALLYERVLDPGMAAMTKQLRPVTMDIYRKTFSRDEIVEMYRFYMSPTGKSVMAKMPAVMEASAKQMMPLMVEFQKLLVAEMKRQMPEIVAEAKRRAAADKAKAK